MKIILFFGILLTLPAFGQVTTMTIKPFTSLCMVDFSSGFDWGNGKWSPKNFKPERYLFQKIDYENQIKAAAVLDRPLTCDEPSATAVDLEKTIVKACYSLRNFGSKSMILTQSQTCYESFKNGDLELIQCPGLGNFKPNGLFVKLPSFISMDLSNKKDKDSIAIDVG
jgi:hypothetical protein